MATIDHDLFARVKRRFAKLGPSQTALPLAGSGQLRRFAMPLGSKALAYGDLDSRVEGCTPDGLPAIDKSGMSAGFVITTARRDRHGDIVEPVGCQDSLADYQANPQVFFSHKSDSLPIANARDRSGNFALWLEAGRITSRAYFHGRTRESDEVFSLLAEGFLRAASIGFVPVEGKLIAPAADDPVDHEGNVDFDMGGILFTKWNLLEWSVVPVPANPEALRARLEQTTKSLSPGVKKSLEPFAKPQKPRRSWARVPASLLLRGVAPYNPRSR